MRTYVSIPLVAFAAVLAASGALWGVAADKEAPGPDAAVEGAVKALKARDINKLMAFYAGHYMSSSDASKEALARRMLGLMDRYDSIAVTRSRVSLNVQMPYAREVVDEVLVAKANGRKEGLSMRRRRLVSYEKPGKRWLITSEEELDREAEKFIKGRLYENDLLGLWAEAPTGWSLHVVSAPLTSILVMTSPDMSAAVSVGRLAVDEAMTAEKALKTNMKAAEKGVKGITRVSEGDVEVAGRKGYQITRDIRMGDRTPRFRRVYAAHGDAFLFVIASAESAGAFEVNGETFDRIMRSLKLSSPKPDPGLGAMDGQTFVNEKYGCRLQLPKGWDATIGKGRGHFTLSFTADKGAVTGTFVCLPAKKTSVELVAMTDEYRAKEVSVGYELIDDGYVHCANAKGYTALSMFTSGGKTKSRKRAYFSAGKYLFCLLVDVTPAPLYKKHALTVEGLLKSIMLPVPERKR